jgi:alkaline phosphatase D
MRLPAIDRPHFITMYFSDVDTAGHRFGPDSQEVQRAVVEVDRLVGTLRTSLQQLGLPINLIVVSDHGMEPVTQEVVSLWKFADLSNVKLSLGGGGLIHIYTPNKQAAEKTYRDLKGKSELFDVFRRAETPRAWNFSSNPRIGDLIVVATRPIVLTGRRPPGPGAESRPAPKGAHGYDPVRFPNMRGIFLAAGPNIRPGSLIEPFENIHVYPFIAKILKLKAPRNIDGKAEVLAPVYRN